MAKKTKKQVPGIGLGRLAKGEKIEFGLGIPGDMLAGVGAAIGSLPLLAAGMGLGLGASGVSLYNLVKGYKKRRRIGRGRLSSGAGTSGRTLLRHSIRVPVTHIGLGIGAAATNPRVRAAVKKLLRLKRTIRK